MAFAWNMRLRLEEFVKRQQLLLGPPVPVATRAASAETAAFYVVWWAGFLRGLLRAYSERHPDVVIEIIEGLAAAEHVALVQRRQIDVAFVGTTTRVADYDIAPLWNERVFVVLPHGDKLGKRTEVEWHALRNERPIIRQAKCDPEFCDPVIGHISNRVRPPAIQMLTVGRETLMHQVAIGRGVTIPQRYIPSEVY